MTTSIQLQDGDSRLAIVQAGKVIAHTSNIALSHAEFVRRTFGELPEGAWVGTIQKADLTAEWKPAMATYAFTSPHP